MKKGDGKIVILFAGGGTAGHLMPAINIALEMTKDDSRIRPVFIGKKGGMEAGIVANFGFEIREIDVVGFKRSIKGAFNFIFKWHKGAKQAQNVMKDLNPDVVVGTGGYVSAPVINAAYKLGKPIFLQEQNSLPGLATRSLAKKANLIFTAYESASRYLPAEKCKSIGNPLRPDILDANKSKAYEIFGLNPNKKTLLILGGSSGAKRINQAILMLLNSKSIPDDWQILWQTGTKDFDQISKLIDVNKIIGKVVPFIKEMPSAYAITNLIISRAGAMALSEITVVGIPSILIPFPFATGDHQTLNARQIEIAGGAIVILEKDIETYLITSLKSLFSDSKKRMQMAQSAKRLGRPEASKLIAETIMEKINEVQAN